MKYKQKPGLMKATRKKGIVFRKNKEKKKKNLF